MAGKLKEGLQHIQSAEKALKTGLLKWNPDYDTAASEYAKAALCFKLGSSLEKSKDTYIKASQMQQKLGSLFQSAKQLTQAAQISVELKQLEHAVELMDRASSLYQEQGSSDTAAMTLAKAAKMCEQGLPDRSFDMYMKAAELCENDEKFRDTSDYLNNAVRMLLKQKKLIKACEIMKERIKILQSIGNLNQGHQVILALIIVYLTEGDYTAAEQSNTDGFGVKGYAESDQAMCAEHFLHSFQEGDEDELKTVKSQPVVTHLDIEVARLAKALRLSNVNVTSITVHDSNGLSELEQFEQTEASSPKDVIEEPPDEDGGLC